MTPYLTDTERNARPAAYRARFRLFLDFVYKGITFRRWFETKDERTRYANALGDGNAILAYGEERTDDV